MRGGNSLLGPKDLFTRWRYYKWRRAGVSIGDGVRLHPRSAIAPGTRIGAYTRANGPLVIKGREIAEIGRYCAIGDGVRIITTDHSSVYANVQYALHERLRLELPLYRSKGPVRIGSATWIGDNVTILPGVSIGVGSVVGAGSVVAKDIPDFCVSAGVPATKVKMRFPDDITALLIEVRWWQWPEPRMQRNRAFFSLDLTATTPDELKAAIVP